MFAPGFTRDKKRLAAAALALAAPLFAAQAWAAYQVYGAPEAFALEAAPANAEKIEKLNRQAVTAYQHFDYQEALDTFKRMLDEPDLEVVETIKFTTAAGACAFHLGDYKHALIYYNRANKLIDALKVDALPDVKAEIICSTGETLYEMGRHPQSAVQFLAAIELWKKHSGTDDILMRSLEGLGASYYQSGQYNRALPIYEELAWRDKTTLGANSIQYGWSLRVLSDIYKALKEDKKTKACFEHSGYLFRQWNLEQRIADLSPDSKLSKGELEARLRERMIGALPGDQDLSFIAPAPFTHVADRGGSQELSEKALVERREHTVPWRRHRIVMERPAGEQWADPMVKPIGIIVCVPGFGLHKNSFDAFAERMAKMGYLVFSYDVRGFGAYTALKARQRIDLFRTLDDLTASARMLKGEFPGLPLFTLGESMGGSIAMQFTAYHPELVDGLIAAVPSAKRYSNWLMNAKMALRLIGSGNKPINLQTYLVDHATNSESLRQSWELDPESRFTINRSELGAYARFLKRNDACARQISKTPVIIFQGLSDLLIRPEGSINLVRELSTRDKDLILIGKSQHLLFEQGQFNDDIIFSVANWMKMHSTQKSAEKQNQKAAQEPVQEPTEKSN